VLWSYLLLRATASRGPVPNDLSSYVSPHYSIAEFLCQRMVLRIIYFYRRDMWSSGGQLALLSRNTVSHRVRFPFSWPPLFLCCSAPRCRSGLCPQPYSYGYLPYPRR
jgi:hypothetical protein